MKNVIKPLILFSLWLFNPACGTEKTFAFERADMIDLLTELSAQDFEQSNDDGDYTLTFAFDLEEESARAWPSLFTQARACSSRSFSASAEACIDDTTMAVQGVVEIRDSTSDEIVAEQDFEGSFLVIGYELDNARIDLNTEAGTISLYSNNGSTFNLEDDAQW